MDSWRLPTSLSVGGVDRPIRTDFRCILDILRMLDDRDLPSWAQTVCLIKMLFIDWKTIPQEQYTEACEKAMSFIDNGIEPEDKDYKKKRPRLMDWDQDAEMIVSAINKVSGIIDVRSVDYLHWWTFLGYYMSIGESLFSSVLNVRYKRAHGKKLEKHEKEFERENIRLVRLRKQRTEEESERLKAERRALDDLIG